MRIKEEGFVLGLFSFLFSFVIIVPVKCTTILCIDLVCNMPSYAADINDHAKRTENVMQKAHKECSSIVFYIEID